MVALQPELRLPGELGILTGALAGSGRHSEIIETSWANITAQQLRCAS